ncbi:MAG: HD domain-containing protein [Fibrobacteria bacterium]|nr:HD domain-containing protein [Fibrobacteria bacterium]
MKIKNSASIKQIKLPDPLQKIAWDIVNQQGKIFLVGGWVRDWLLGISSKDYDLEIYGIELDELVKILSGYGTPNLVGKSFGVITMRISGINYDFAFPRTESKTGKGHRGFMVKPDSSLTFNEASSRRDFTINAMGIRIPELILEDPHGGQKDLEKRLLRHVSDAFSEDPLRAMRAIQFAARFELEIDSDTQGLCSKQPLEELPAERLFEEFKKLLLKANKPSIGLEWMRKMDMLRYFPELKALVGTKQDPIWHPEGDVWAHNNLVINAAAHIRDTEIDIDEEKAEFEKLALMFGALCHDLGKPATTVLKDGKWRSPAHSAWGERPARSFLARLTRDKKLVEQVIVYVREHLKPAQLYNARDVVKDSTIRRLSLKVDIEKLVRMAKADHFGRETPDALEESFEAGDWLLEKSRALQVLDSKPEPLLTGKMLLSLGMKPGPQVGNIIRESFDLQLEGKLETKEAVLEWAKKKLV